MKKRKTQKPKLKKAWGGWVVYDVDQPSLIETYDEKSGAEPHLETIVFWSEEVARKRGQDVRRVIITVED